MLLFRAMQWFHNQSQMFLINGKNSNIQFVASHLAEAGKNSLANYAIHENSLK